MDVPRNEPGAKNNLTELLPKINPAPVFIPAREVRPIRFKLSVQCTLKHGYRRIVPRQLRAICVRYRSIARSAGDGVLPKRILLTSKRMQPQCPGKVGKLMIFR